MANERVASSGLRSILVLSILGSTLVLPTSLAAQSATLVGVVTERDTQAPLPGVHVALLDEGGGTRAAALTDESGRAVLRGEPGATYRLRAERVGMASATTEAFTLGAGTSTHRLEMVERAIELEGLTVPTPVRLCDIDPREGLAVQRWWDEIRKALQSAAFVHANELDRFRFERFQREWTRDLRALRAERYFAVADSVARPFMSQDARTLSERGFVQGEVGERRFLAPDAAVLLSDHFLRDHCFGLEPAGDDLEQQGERSRNLRISVEPVESRDVPEVHGFMEIDTLTMELRSFQFEYVNLPDDLPSRSAAGGHLSFAYLPSGAWIVSEWWVRMPWVDPRVFPRTVLAYLDEGGRVSGVAMPGGVIDPPRGGGTLLGGGGTLQGAVYDSLRGGPLGGARVSVVGARTSVRTDADGTFTLTDLPRGRLSISVHHADLVRLGLPAPVIPVELEEDAVDSISVTLPGFTAVAQLLCGAATAADGSVLTGRVMVPGVDTVVAGPTEVRARWSGPPAEGGRAVSMYADGTTGSRGRYVLCGLPAGMPVTLGVRVDSGWRLAGAATLPEQGVVARDLRPEARALDAVIRGSVHDAATGSGLASSTVSLMDPAGDSIASVSTDVSGQFRLVVPTPGEYAVTAFSEGYPPRSSELLSIAEGEVLDLLFEMSAAGLAMRRVQGRVLDARSGDPIAVAGVHLLADDERPLALAMTDSAGTYSLMVPSTGGEHALLVQGAGYHEREMPLPTAGAALDFALEPEAFELDPLTVRVRNEEVVDWLTLALGANPAQFFGFRVLQGARLAEAKRRGQARPTETLRWLYVPVWHGGACVAINITPRAVSAASGGPRVGPFLPGAAPGGTSSSGEHQAGPEPDRCGRLYVDGRMVPNDRIEEIDMSTISVVTTLPGEVRMFTYDFDWAFRPR